MPDLAESVVAKAQTTVRRPDAKVMDKLSACLVVGLFEACRTIANEHQGKDSRSIAKGTGPSYAQEFWAGTPERAVAAGSFLMHRELRDDAYQTAFHPGQVVIPTALACGRAVRATGQEILEAMLFGYEVSCHLAELMLPQASVRGWRITAALAPVAAAATACRLFADVEKLESSAASAIRLAASVSGGGLAPVAAGGDWRVQPGVAASAGVLAGRMAADGYIAQEGSVEAPLSALSLIAGHWNPESFDQRPRIHGVSFKTESAPMYAQGILHACRALRPTGAIDELNFEVSPFTAAYAESGRADDSVADLRTIILDNQAGFAWPKPITRAMIDIAPDAQLSDLSCRLTARINQSADVIVSASGDTTGWGLVEAVQFCETQSGTSMTNFAATVRSFDQQAGFKSLEDAFAELLNDWLAAQSRPGSGNEHIQPEGSTASAEAK